MDFKQELQARGAREFQIVQLSGDEARALAAIAEAERRGIEHVIAYATTLYEDPGWRPTGARSRPGQVTNTFVEVSCAHCGGDRFVPVGIHDPLLPYDETYAPCKVCNANANTRRWVFKTEVRTAPR